MSFRQFHWRISTRGIRIKREKSRGRGTSVAALVDEVVAVDLLEALHLHRAHGPQVGQLVQHLRLQHTRADATASRISHPCTFESIPCNGAWGDCWTYLFVLLRWRLLALTEELDALRLFLETRNQEFCLVKVRG